MSEKTKIKKKSMLLCISLVGSPVLADGKGNGYDCPDETYIRPTNPEFGKNPPAFRYRKNFNEMRVGVEYYVESLDPFILFGPLVRHPETTKKKEQAKAYLKEILFAVHGIRSPSMDAFAEGLLDLMDWNIEHQWNGMKDDLRLELASLVKYVLKRPKYGAVDYSKAQLCRMLVPLLFPYDAKILFDHADSLPDSLFIIWEDDIPMIRIDGFMTVKAWYENIINETLKNDPKTKKGDR